MTITCPFLWNGSSKIQFFTDFITFSVGGCWGQPMVLFWKVVNETQMSKPPEATRHHNSTKLLLLLHLRAIYFSTFQYETPCRSDVKPLFLFRTLNRIGLLSPCQFLCMIWYESLFISLAKNSPHLNFDGHKTLAVEWIWQIWHVNCIVCIMVQWFCFLWCSHLTRSELLK